MFFSPNLFELQNIPLNPEYSKVTTLITKAKIAIKIPAKIIKYRFEQDEIIKLLDLEWWDLNIDVLRANYKKFHNIKDLLSDEDFLCLNSRDK